YRRDLDDGDMDGAVRGVHLRLRRAGREAETARGRRRQDAVGRAGVDEEEAGDVAVEGRVDEPALAVAVEPDLARAAAGPVRGRGSDRQQTEHDGEPEPPRHRASGA